MKNKIFLSGNKKISKLRLTRLLSTLGMTFMLLSLALFTTQCKEDKFTGEVVGVCPEVILTSPINGAINVVTNKSITATFNEAMNPSTVNETTFILKKAGSLVSGAVTYSGTTATFNATNLLIANTVYSATILRRVTDPMGNIMRKDTTWSFNTGAIPAVVLTNPTQGASDIPLNKVITAEFSNAMNAATINSSSFIVKHGANLIAGTVSYLGLKATFTPTNLLLANKVYTATITTEATDLAGNALAKDTTWSFATNFFEFISGPPLVDLGAANSFVILAGSGVSNIGVSTSIIGDVGSFPTATMNGLLSGNVVGNLYTVANPLVGTAKTALTAAYNDAQGRSLDAISLPGQLGGLTLPPGLYVNSSTTGISGTGSNAILTLDAEGNPNSFWIFKMGSTLVTTAGTKIVLANGAKAKNIYWSVGTSATLGTNSIFYGNILADQSITLTTGASLTGRALTRIGTITLDSNAVTKP